MLLIVIHLGSCQPQRAARPETGSVQPLKGYELYSWQIDRDWHFALVLGTNRAKSYDEVTSPELVVRGVQSLKRELDRLPSGVQVFWSAQRVPNVALPPDDIVKEISAYCRQLGIPLWIDGVPASASATLASASPVPSASLPAVQTPKCEAHAATMTLASSATVLEMGQMVTVTVGLANMGCVDLGMPQYRLSVQSENEQPILEPNPPTPILHVVAIHPGEADAAEFVLRAVGLGEATLDGGASFEAHLGYPGPTYWGHSTSEPITITVTSAGIAPCAPTLQTATAVPTPTATSGLPAPSAAPTGVAASLLMHKMAEPGDVRANEVITYTIVMMNDQLDGADPGVSVTLTDDIPRCVTYVRGTASSGAHYDAVADRITWAGAVPRGLSVAVSFQVFARDCALTDGEIENVALVRDAFGRMAERWAYVSVEEALPVVAP